MSVQLLFVHALSPLHAGTGQSVGAIELAIARDRATGFPYLPGSSIKGPLRDRARPEQVNALFGPPTKDAADHAGALVFGDANLLLLPVRSVAGTFAWATSPYLLQRFVRDCKEAGIGSPPVPAPAQMGECLVANKGSKLVVTQRQKQRVIFEDLDFDAKESEQAGQLAATLGAFLFPDEPAWQNNMMQRLCVVHDDVMSFLSEHATDVVARVALKDDSKTVENLWHEESLPTESILVSLVQAAPNGKTGMNAVQLLAALRSVASGTIQLGGKATVGRGRCRLVLKGGA